MNDVFISYSRRDKVFTQKLYEALTAANRIVWADWDSIPAASDWDAEIKQGIQETNSVLFVLSPEWIKSNECRKEMVHAVAMGKRLFPILYIPVDPKDVPPELAKINWVYLRDSDDFDKGFQTLCSAMDTDLEWIKTHTRIQVRAVEWEKKNRSASFALRGEDLTEGEKFIAEAANKTPVPTALQSEYILASRTDATKRQRQTLAGVTVALVVSIALGVVAFFQRQEAVKQAKISRSGELAAQTQLLITSNLQDSTLLGIEAFREWDTLQSRSALLDSTNTNPQLIQFFTGHSDQVRSIAFSPDGKTLASGNLDKTIRLWDVATGKQIGHPLTGHKNGVSSIAFSPNGKILASGSWDSTVILWDTSTGEPIGQPLVRHKGHIYSVAFSPDGKTLASGGCQELDSSENCMSGEIILWDVASRQSIGQPITGFKAGVSSLAFSADGKILASGSCGEMASNGSCKGEIVLWDTARYQPIGQPLTGHTNSVSSVAFSPDGKTLASGSYDNTIILWDVGVSQPIGVPLEDPAQGFLGGVYSVVFSPNGETLAAGIGDRIILWDISSRNIAPALTANTGFVLSVAFSPNGNILASGSFDGSIILWDLVTRNPIGQSLKGYANNVYSVVFNPDGKTLATSGEDGNIILWDLASHRPMGEPLIGHLGRVPSIVFSPDGKSLASAGFDNTIILWDVATGKQIGPPLSGTSSIFSMAFSPNGKTLASGNSDNTISLWDVATGKQIGQPIMGHTGAVSSIAFSHDGKTLASGSWDGTVILWDGATGQQIGQPLARYAGAIFSIAFSPDDKTLATTDGSDGTIYLWDVKNRINIGQPLNRVSKMSVRSLAFSPDGKILASGGDDGAIVLWEVKTHRPIGQQFTWVANSGVYSVAFSTDGKTLASGGSDGNIILWNIDPQSWIEKSCQRVGRNFNLTEWQQYFPNEKYRKTCEQWPLEPEVTVTPIATQ